MTNDDDDVEHQPAPQRGVDVGQSEHAAPQQHGRECREHDEQQQHPDPTMPHALPQYRGAERHQQGERDIDAPDLIGRITSIEEPREAHADEGPAGAITGARSACHPRDRGMRHGPTEQRRQDERDASNRTMTVRMRVEDRAEQVLSRPVDSVRQPAAGVSRQQTTLGRLAMSGDNVAHRPTSATRRLYQFMNAETMRLMERNTPIRRTIDLDLAVRLHHRGAGEDLVQLGICYRRAERARLDDVEVLAGDRRHHHAQRLWQDDLGQHLARPQPQAQCCLALALVHRQDGGAHDLGDEGGAINRAGPHTVPPAPAPPGRRPRY